MPIIYFRCPSTGRDVQGWIADSPDIEDGESFQPVKCAACGRFHYISPKSANSWGIEEGCALPALIVRKMQRQSTVVILYIVVSPLCIWIPDIETQCITHIAGPADAKCLKLILMASIGRHRANVSPNC
jgi:hypothetical protein